MTNSSIKYALIGIVILAIVFAVWFLFIRSTAPTSNTLQKQVFSSAAHTDAYVLGIAAARAWHTDAVLDSIGSNVPAANGESIWMLMFTSPSYPKKGYQVLISGNSITSKQEIIFSGKGSALPTNLISPNDAIALALRVPGYANVTVLGVEAIYGPTGAQWYWGVKTSKGTVTVKATK